MIARGNILGRVASVFSWQLGMTLIERKTIGANVSSVTFSNLNGNQDRIYVLYSRLIAQGATPTIFQLLPNGLTTNLSGVITFTDGVSTFLSAPTDGSITNSITAGAYVFGDMIIMARTSDVAVNFNRQATGRFTRSAGLGVGTVGWLWTESVTNITSLVINSSVASGLGAGSTLALYRLGQI